MVVVQPGEHRSTRRVDHRLARPPPQPGPHLGDRATLDADVDPGPPLDLPTDDQHGATPKARRTAAVSAPKAAAGTGAGGSACGPATG